jgi:hypothetical protein
MRLLGRPRRFGGGGADGSVSESSPITKCGKLMIYFGCKTGKALPATGRVDPYVCETSRLSNFLDNRLTDTGKVVSLTRRPPFAPPPTRNIPGTHFC